MVSSDCVLRGAASFAATAPNSMFSSASRSRFCMILRGSYPSTNVGEGGKSSQTIAGWTPEKPFLPRIQQKDRGPTLLPRFEGLACGLSRQSLRWLDICRVELSFGNCSRNRMPKKKWEFGGVESAVSSYGVTCVMKVFQFALTVRGRLAMYSFPTQMFPELSETAAE